MTTSPTRSRGGRRPGGGDTRAEILDAARAAFAERGYADTTVRAVAERAQVNPALVFHYFGSKEALFGACLALPVDVDRVLAELLDGIGPDPDAETVRRVADGAVRFYLGLWEDAATAATMRAMVPAGLSGERGGELLHLSLQSPLLTRVAEALGVDRVAERVAVICGQMFGLAVARYVVGVGPLAAMPVDDVVAWASDTLVRGLTADR